ncbi:TetR/AcrR family transcriptional regulator [Mycobacterium sp.]|uniref:TetR/AcrR family transcriptional regulator n=1 Tax=Mycobacterium sp. TaxID=1785 RepID=UPI001270F150|nr:TetR/AcrR family transcriptional regulator [Mycobacterium sp.]KAA8969232.1 MAG: TetR/AcrR family transcriptional regulator [Mycobacterium sp.]
MAQQVAVRPRRRGKELEHALYDAALAELADVGYAGLTMERIAARAHTGKAALYRRWSSKRSLIRDALEYALPAIPEPCNSRSARENLLAVFTAHCDVLAGKTAFPGLAIIAQLIHAPELRAIFADAVVAPRLRIIESILCAGARDGEIKSDMLGPLAARVGPALINQHLMLTGAPPSKHDLIRIVDTVIPPASATGTSC